jgi:hypothetical protein
VRRWTRRRPAVVGPELGALMEAADRLVRDGAHGGSCATVLGGRCDCGLDDLRAALDAMQDRLAP